jgi:hypothetical protein
MIPLISCKSRRPTESNSCGKRLIALRDSEITPAPPDAPAEKNLLREDLLEEFIEKRPKTKDEWFKKIPQPLRAGVDSKQVGKYLPRVLEIIGEYAT